MQRPKQGVAFLPLDLDHLRNLVGTGGSISWWKGGNNIGHARVNLGSSPREMSLSFELLSASAGKAKITRRHRVELRSAALHFGRRWFFACPSCNRRVRILYLAARSPTSAPYCRVCAGIRYESQKHHRGHLLARRHRVLRLLRRAEDLLTRRGLRADRRWLGVELLRDAEVQLREFLAQVAARGAATASLLEARLFDATRGGPA